ncbi:unnamed protein product, partial [Ascophyllum nodosum]
MRAMVLPRPAHTGVSRDRRHRQGNRKAAGECSRDEAKDKDVACLRVGASGSHWSQHEHVSAAGGGAQ